MIKTSKYLNRHSILLIVFAMTLAVVCGCASSKPAIDPLTGFYTADLRNLISNNAITSDYKNYIKTLSPKEQKFAGPIIYFENGAGLHAVKILIGINGKVWEHVLIYDKDNHRIKMIKYRNGGYVC